MYPKYFKKTKEADACFAAIKSFEGQKQIKKYSVCLDKNDTRFYTKISSDFGIEAFSPHSDDMNSSNNCSLVCKIKERSTGRTYLVTGDTENSRWSSITKIFGKSIQADILDAPHHGSRNGISKDAIGLILPHTVIVSAGVENQYSHPHSEAETLFKRHAKKYYATLWGGGQSLKTVADKAEINTYKFTP